jgi:hypothetical protein
VKFRDCDSPTTDRLYLIAARRSQIPNIGRLSRLRTCLTIPLTVVPILYAPCVVRREAELKKLLVWPFCAIVRCWLQVTLHSSDNPSSHLPSKIRAHLQQMSFQELSDIIDPISSQRLHFHHISLL